MYLAKSIQPDFQGFKANILRKGTPERVYNVELFLDGEMQRACGEYFGINPAGDDWENGLRWRVDLHRRLGYETIRVGPYNYDWPMKRAQTGDTTADVKNRGDRSWVDEGIGVIASWDDFEKYPWPDPDKADYREFDWCEKNLPDGMCCYSLTAHILENVMWLMGYEGLAVALFDQPDLVDAMFRRVGENQVKLTRRMVEYKKLGIVWGSDDMGFKTGCMISPKTLIEKALPWHRRCAEAAHEHDRLYFLHSCGKLDDIMDALIDDVRIDAKHSWEDTIMTVTEAKKKWGNRIGILGGIDVDFLCQASEEDIRKRVRATLDRCLPGGGYCLGTGNSVANYIPMKSYLAMLDEGQRYCG